MARRDPGQNLHWMEDELLSEEEWEEEESDEYGEEAEFDEGAAVRPYPENRRKGKLLLLLILEVGAIAAIVRWWMQWW